MQWVWNGAQAGVCEISPVMLLRSLVAYPCLGGGSPCLLPQPLPCTGHSLWMQWGPLKVPPAWGEKKLWWHKMGLGGQADRGLPACFPPVLTGQRGVSCGALPACGEGASPGSWPGGPSFFHFFTRTR